MKIAGLRVRITIQRNTAVTVRCLDAARDRHRARAAVGADGEALRVTWVRAGEVSL